MKNVVYLNAATIVIAIVLLVILNSEHRKVTTTRSKLLNVSLILIMFSGLFGIIYTNTDKYCANLVDVDLVKTISVYIYFIIYMAIWLIYFYYNYYMIRPYDKSNVKTNIIFICPYLTVLVLLFFNTITKWLFSFDEEMNLKRGNYFWTIYVLCVLYAVVVFFGILIKNRKQIGIYKLVPSLACQSIFVIGVIVQYIWPFLQVENFTMVLGYVILIMNVQNPREIIDNETTLLNYGCFKEEIFKNLNDTKEFDILYIYMGELDNYRAIYENSFYYRLLKTVGKRIKSIRKDVMAYRIKSDVFVILYKRNEQKYYKRDIDAIRKAFMDKMEVYDRELLMQPVLMLTKCPQDVTTMEDIIENAIILKQKFKYYKGDVLTINKEEFETQKKKKHINRILDEIISDKDRIVRSCPIYLTKSNKVVRAHVQLDLSKYNDCEYTYYEFIKACGSNEKVIRVENLLFEKVCEMLSLKDEQLKGATRINMSLSNVHYMRDDLLDDVKKTLDRYKISPKQIFFGISGDILSNMNYTLNQNLFKFKQAGIGIYLEEYGVGKSNLDNLINVDVDFVELGKSIYEISNTQYRYKTIVKRQVEIVHKLGSKILISGLQNASQILDIQELNADYYKLQDE